ncbi:winged helix-turn-helix transcriptional regulator [Vannielia litorea]|uniref:winged helix-turn-helix transcriptional regulator n=1 Tax=Vannielia litorea TaxID=1217970 RepID=UPI001C9537E2|nr:helix-turn-helix domain-containing protein [Vannielia litorea]MBY6048401.1 helix-turn-helix transcriptional regulator [Vannielia litorea]MBY6075815.1 helix-turn-helix transcriptional regulator [Vannielia litorea]
MTDQTYPRFCPVAMAASLLEPRWTMLVLCEMWNGSTRFSEIQRGVPGMSPGLLSKRLKEMEANGLVMRHEGSGAHGEYLTTAMADELQPLVRGLGEWAHRHVDCEVSLKGLDARMLMWNIRRKVDTLQLPRRRSVIQFILKDTPEGVANYWLVTRPGEETDLCLTDPKHDVDLYLSASLRDLTAAWMGHSSFEAEILADRIQLTGHELMARSLTRWLIRSSYAELDASGSGSAARRVRGC